jgi:hypothetical protein
MALIFVDPTAAGDAGFILADGECYQYIGESDQSPNVTTATAIESCAECWPPGESCGYCSPIATPEYFTVVFSGVTISNDCQLCEYYDQYFQISGALDGTYCLTQTGPCSWTAPTIITTTVYSNDGCSGPGTTSEAATITLSCTDGYWELVVDSPLSIANAYVYFSASTVEGDLSGDCSGFTGSNNIDELNCEDGIDTWFVGIGGSATVTPSNCGAMS